MSYEFAKKEIGDYRITITRMRMPNALAQNGIWQAFTSGTILITDTTGNFLVVVAVKSKLKMQRLP